MTFSDLINKAASYDQESIELDINLDLNVDSEVYRAYTVSIAYCDLMFYTDKGILTYVVDKYKHKNVAELYSVEKY